MAMEQDGAGARESVLQGKWVFRTLPILFFLWYFPLSLSSAKRLCHKYPVSVQLTFWSHLYLWQVAGSGSCQPSVMNALQGIGLGQ